MLRTTLVGGFVVTALVAALAGPVARVGLAQGQQASMSPRQDAGKKTSTTTGTKGTQPAPVATARAGATSGASEFQAVLDAGKIRDPQKREEALRKAVQDIRTTLVSGLAQTLQASLLSNVMSAAGGGTSLDTVAALADVVKDDNKKLLDAANKVVSSAPIMSRGTALNNVADRLMVAGVLLDEAEDFANRSIASYNEKTYLERQKKLYADMADALARIGSAASLPQISDESTLQQMRAQKAISQTTLGEIWMKKGRNAEAEKLFKEIYTSRPSAHSVGMAAGYLADMAKKAGRDAELVEYLVAVDAAGELTAARRKDLESSYRKLHNDSLAGLDEVLDARYLKDNANHVQVTPYARPPKRTDRVVLAELFTGAGCPPCAGVDLAFDGVLERYSRQDVALLVYHEHVPVPDPMTNPSTVARSKFYGVQGVPTFWIDGETSQSGGGSVDMAQQIYDGRVQPAIEKRLATPPGIKLRLTATMERSVIKVNVDVGKPATAAKRLKLQIALVEERLRYPGQNHVRFHPMVVRSLGGMDSLGFALNQRKAATVTHTFDLDAIVAANKAHLDDYEAKNGTTGKFQFTEKKHDMNRANLAVIAFVQDEDSKQVLQAAFFKVPQPSTKTM